MKALRTAMVIASAIGLVSFATPALADPITVAIIGSQAAAAIGTVGVAVLTFAITTALTLIGSPPAGLVETGFGGGGGIIRRALGFRRLEMPPVKALGHHRYMRLTLRGTCMEPIARDGSFLIADTRSHIRAGDMVAIGFVPGAEQGPDMMKRFCYAHDDLIVVATTNPPQQVEVPFRLIRYCYVAGDLTRSRTKAIWNLVRAYGYSLRYEGLSANRHLVVLIVAMIAGDVLTVYFAQQLAQSWTASKAIGSGAIAAALNVPVTVAIVVTYLRMRLRPTRPTAGAS